MQVVLGLIVICDYTNVSYISFSFINLLQPPHASILHPIVTGYKRYNFTHIIAILEWTIGCAHKYKVR